MEFLRWHKYWVIRPLSRVGAMWVGLGGKARVGAAVCGSAGTPRGSAHVLIGAAAALV